LDPLRQTDRAIALRREVALQPDDVGIERPARREARLLAVDAEVVHLALVSVSLEACRDADRTQRLDERQHLQAENSADGRLDERDLHVRETLTRSSHVVISRTAQPMWRRRPRRRAQDENRRRGRRRHIAVPYTDL